MPRQQQSTSHTQLPGQAFSTMSEKSYQQVPADPYVPTIVQDLLMGKNEWKNI